MMMDIVTIINPYQALYLGTLAGMAFVLGLIVYLEHYGIKILREA